MTASTFRLGARSRKELDGVHRDLVRVVERAIELTPVDFAVHDGLRTPAEQRALVARGASTTTDSRHLTGHAVDLVPFVGKLRWEWPLIYPIADAVRQAARECNVPIRWGGAWDVPDLSATWEAPEDIVEAYVARRKAMGLRAFIDGPHFELPRSAYP